MTGVWIILLLAGLFEVCWAVALKYTEGFTKLWPSLFAVITLGLSVYLLSIATKKLELSVAYAVWVGIGTVGASLLGILLFKEVANPAKLVFLGLLIVSIIGLKYSA
ncbi:MAG: multidrug efflux SMR transporter [Anaerolineales bacterium]|nr:multidrug efflux SMR transporter [Anaerolineales bacterium]QYK50095.1 MAG: multidrug efflux SMR transporter [Anaerolineales bacterium]